MKERKHSYVVGYPGAAACVYGKDRGGRADWTRPMTAHQARGAQKKMPCDGARIFRLVDVTDELLKKKP
ncbi:MAG: hypothetical protein HQ582_22165 [Planctomycetes bacterium]|nr:hypothetical protein [Planctomycetota bacterium]